MKTELTCEEAISVIKDYFASKSQQSIAASLGVSEKALYNILYLITYKECTKEHIREVFGNTTDYFIELAARKSRGLSRIK